MQSFNVDISAPATPMVLFTMQADSMSRFFSVTIVDNGAPWQAPEGAAWTVRFGAPGMPAGWYDTIEEPGGGSHAAIVIDGNTATVEIAEQAISTPGKNILCVLINDAQGYQLASWQFQLSVQPVPGLEAPEATVYYNALTEQVAQTLVNSQSAAASAQQAQEYAESINPSSLAPVEHASAETTYGVASATLFGHAKLTDSPGNQDASAGVAVTPAGLKSALLNSVYPVGSIYMSANNVSPQTFLGGTWQQIQGQFLLAASSSYPAGSTGGAAEVTLSQAQLPAYNPGARIQYDSSPQTDNVNAIVTTWTNSWTVNNASMAPLGDGDPVSTLPPYLAVYMWQRTA